MIGVPSYAALGHLDFAMGQDGRSYRSRLEEFFIRICALARSSVDVVGTRRAFVSSQFHDEMPPFAARILSDNFEMHKLEDFRLKNHGNHSLGDPSKIMSFNLACLCYADILEGYLTDLKFFQYLAPDSVIACVHYGVSTNGPVSTGFEGLVRHFSSTQDLPSVKFVRVSRHWQMQS